jgi:hypothetical protein
MDGRVIDRELATALNPADALRTRFARASERNDAAIRRLLRENSMHGAVSLTFEREPNYFAGANVASAEDETIVAWSGGRLVCMGRCSRRACWVDGDATRVGYLAELRLDSAARGRFALVRNGYRYFRAMQRDDDDALYFTSIGSDNARARRLLERGARGMPRYSFLSELVTLLIAVPRAPRKSNFRVESAAVSDIPDIVSLLNDHGRDHQLATVWNAEQILRLEQHGLPLNRFRLIMDGGRLLACGALWDQRGFRQTVIRGYSPLLAVVRPFVNLAGMVFDTSRMPSRGSTLAHAFLSPLAIARDASDSLPAVIEAFLPTARESRLDYLTIALPATDSRLQSLQRHFPHRRWNSRLYRVDWPDRAPIAISSCDKPYLPDIALL